MKLPCWLVGHDIKITQLLPRRHYRSVCTKCRKMFLYSYTGTNPDNVTSRTPWTDAHYIMYQRNGIKIHYGDGEL